MSCTQCSSSSFFQEAAAATHPPSTFCRHSSTRNGHLGARSYPLRAAKAQGKLWLKEHVIREEKRRWILPEALGINSGY
ncbi:hypothetical protein VNO80_25712 [Phaseolus coccineus]|uniref:Uncharacterized protein n=1 Tax=Phaseolus coccineus TaxID=3886 RepID=A0AAN9QQC9_PHACN